MSNSETNINSAYQKLLDSNELHEDSIQNNIVQHFSRLQNELLNKKQQSFFGSIFKRSNNQKHIKGIYLHGGVGRGKTFLMDLFFNTTKIKKKHRVHFHAFMLDVHSQLYQRRDGKIEMLYNKDSAILDYAEHIAKEYRLLCFDELHVKDITDAMILSRLFSKLIELGVVVVFTSNFDVDDLYKNGLQRELFLPFIALIKQNLNIIHMQSDKDYRLNLAWAEGTWCTPLTEDTNKKLEDIFDVLTAGKEKQDRLVSVKGREITAYQSTNEVAKFDFSELCVKARGAVDYLELCRHFDTIVLTNVPRLNDELRNETRRFMILIDTLYEKKKHLIVSAETELSQLYAGKENSFEFDRTLSRLQEMQSKEYWEN